MDLMPQKLLECVYPEKGKCPLLETVKLRMAQSETRLIPNLGEASGCSPGVRVGMLPVAMLWEWDTQG